MLNLSQQQAVRTTEGTVRIIAGAGTGKTHTLVSRIAHLITEKKVQPEVILALTFTNKAAHELAERLRKKNLPPVHTLTFHSLAARLLRRFWSPDFLIVTAREQAEILSEILEPAELDALQKIAGDLDALRQNETKKIIASGLSENRLLEILAEYKSALDKKNAVDFTGLLTKLLEVWNENPAVLIQCQKLYHYILADEYQDVNGFQIKILMKLAELHQNLCVVGDPDQTIYSWRGARAETMTRFEQLYPKSVSVSLTKNYRNPPAILKGAENLISRNTGRLKKTMESAVIKPQGITEWISESEEQKNEIVDYLLERYIGSPGAMQEADLLDAGRDEGFWSLKDIAFLYRARHEGRKLNERLSRRGFPCQLSSGETFWDRAEITECMECLDNLRQWTDISKEAGGKKFSEWMREKIDRFIESQSFTPAQKNRLSHLLPWSMAFDPLPVKEGLAYLLDEARLQQEADNLILADKINLLTLHAAKGLEFPIVIITGLEEDSLPHKKLKNDPYWLAEERRLLYVGMTRATHELHLIYNAKAQDKIQEPSRFLKEIGEENMTQGQLPEIKIRQVRKREIKKAQMSLF